MMFRRELLLGGAASAGLGLVTQPSSAYAQTSSVMNTQKFEFVSDGNHLSGFADVPANSNAHALILIIHGYGETDVAGRTSYYDLRSRFTQLGITTVIWDKPGCGESGGKFDAEQPVESSATEVRDAILQLKTSLVPGVQKVGLWGISRAGWIAPLAITMEPDIAFWISVSGTDDKENFPYLLESNLSIEGRTGPEIKRLIGEWWRGFEITSQGGPFQDYLAATQNLWRDPFMLYLTGGSGPNEASFHKTQEKFRSGAFQVDKETGLQIYVPHFQTMLARLNVPVLAIFGERDRNVNWRSTAGLYSRTIGQNPQASLSIKTFPDGNHNLQQARTGGLREMIEMKERPMCAGYFEAMSDWLREKVPGSGGGLSIGEFKGQTA